MSMSPAPRAPCLRLQAAPDAAPSCPPDAPDAGSGPVADAAVALGEVGVVAERGVPLRASPARSAVGEASASVEPEPVRLVAPTAASPFAPGREVAFARVEGDLLARLGVRHGDHVAVWRRDTVEPGDLAAVLDASGRAGLWRVYPERDELRLTTGDPSCARRSGRRPRVQGVVVAVHRSFATPAVASTRRPPSGAATRERPTSASARTGAPSIPQRA